MKIATFALAMNLGLATLQAPAASNDIVPYPAGYRKWVLVKTTVILPENESFQRNGGMHLFYANKQAMEGYATGKFPDGSVLVDDLVVADQEKGYITAGTRKRVAVMLKQSESFKDTNGWGYEIFPANTQAPSLDAERKGACFACHQKADDAVFSKFHE